MCIGYTRPSIHMKSATTCANLPVNIPNSHSFVDVVYDVVFMNIKKEKSNSSSLTTIVFRRKIKPPPPLGESKCVRGYVCVFVREKIENKNHFSRCNRYCCFLIITTVLLFLLLLFLFFLLFYLFRCKAFVVVFITFMEFPIILYIFILVLLGYCHPCSI